jgi:hypothetical protein
MCPYVVLQHNGRKYKTTVHEDGGTAPLFNQVFDLYAQLL